MCFIPIVGACKEPPYIVPPPIVSLGVLVIGNKNPIMALHELRPSSKYELLSDTGGEHEKLFIMCVVVNEGCGRTKQMAKYHAAKAALLKAFIFRQQQVAFLMSVFIYSRLDDHCVFWDWTCFALGCQLP